MPKKKNTVRADGRIAVQVFLGRDEEGKRRYKTVYGATQKEADKKAEQIRLSMRKGLDIAAEHDTFRDWSERWMRIKETDVSEGQLGAYRSAAKHLNKYLESIPISKIKAADIQEIILNLARLNPSTQKPSSRQTLKSVRISAMQIFQLAIENRVIDYNPVQAVRIPSAAPQQTRRALTTAEQKWIINTDHRAKCAAMVMMYAGLRRGELIPLTWNDIDLPNRTISVHKSVEAINNTFRIKQGTKTEAGTRVVDIPLVLADYLRALPRDGVFVCTSTQGKMHTPSSWERMWESYLLELNLKCGDFSPFVNRPKSKFDPKGTPFVIPKITPHWLRHTFATMLYHAGVDVMTAKEQLGHSNINVTLEIYTHLDKTHKRRSMDKLDVFLGDASQMQVND